MGRKSIRLNAGSGDGGEGDGGDSDRIDPAGARTDSGRDLPVNLTKLILAIQDKGVKRGDVERRAGWFPNRIHDWQHKGGELTADQAWQAAEVLDVPFQYLVDNSIPIQSPPPRREMFDNTSYMERARSMQLSPTEAMDGMILLSLCKANNVGIQQAIRYITTLVGERMVEEGESGYVAPTNPEMKLKPKAEPEPETKAKPGTPPDTKKRRNGSA